MRRRREYRAREMITCEEVLIDSRCIRVEQLVIRIIRGLTVAACNPIGITHVIRTLRHSKQNTDVITTVHDTAPQHTVLHSATPDSTAQHHTTQHPRALSSSSQDRT